MSSVGTWLPEEVPDRTRLLELSHGRVFTVDVGPGPQGASHPPMLLLHGLFATQYVFDRLIPTLARHRRVVAIDLPGCGDSDAPQGRELDGGFPWLAEVGLQVMGALDIGRFDVVGHDVGGTVAMHLAAEHPVRLRALVLMAPIAITVSLPLAGSLAVVPSFGQEVFRRTLRRADVKRFWEQCASTPELVTDAQVDVVWDRLGRPGARETAYDLLAQLSSVVRLRDRFSSVRAPTLVIWGDRDRLVTPDQGERLVELLPDASLELLEGCGHNPADEQAERVAALIEAHTSAARRGPSAARP